MAERQLPAAWARSFSVRGNWTSFSASAKVLVVTSGPTAGEGPKAGGAPGGGGGGGGWAERGGGAGGAPGVDGVAGVWANAGAAAEASRVSVLWVRNSRREFDMGSSAADCSGRLRRSCQ